MKYRNLGRTGVQVSSQCLGAAMFGRYGNRDDAESARMIGRALESGVNFIDTADVYSRGESEEIVGRALAGRRDDVVPATKCVSPMGRERNHRGGSRRWITRAAEDSLRRLGTDYIAPFVCEQPQYSLFARKAEEAVLPACRRHAMAVIAWSPLAGGWLTGKYRRGAAAPEGSRYAPGGTWARWTGTVDLGADPRTALVERLSAVAENAGLTMTQLGLGFVASHPAVTSTIDGPKTLGQLEEILAAADTVLAPDVLDAVDEIVPPGSDAAGMESHSALAPVMARGRG